jgi:Adenylate and Guanylate cyclase catalytic domain
VYSKKLTKTFYFHFLCIRDDLVGQAESEGWVEYYKYFLEPGVDPFQPVLDVLYPIVDDVSRVELMSSPDYDPTNHTLVGLVTVSIYWREIIRNVLSPGSNDVVIVVDNECTDSFTYKIVGPDVTYLGVLDHHNTKYDGFVVSTKVVDLHEFSFQENVYSGAPIDKEFCQYTFRLYPSEDLKSDCTTNNAVAYMLVALVSFAILALIFISYDLRVENRQKKVLSYAVRSSEIVSSLFPKSVQDQLYPTLAESDKSNAPSRPYHETHQELTLDGPIAKLYPETTVMFADIKGFTQWSSSREPTDVFFLLETLYGAMDRNAKFYGVFKVETIGDTYVAVAGLPTARKHHAVVMAKFAKKCLIAMSELAQDLVATLGPVRTCHFNLPMWALFEMLNQSIRVTSLFSGHSRSNPSHRIELGSDYCGRFAWRKGSVPALW